jgi:hypothetical protein
MNYELELFNVNLQRYVVSVSAKTSALGRQALFRFPNGYGASLIQGPYTYGGEEGLFELAVVLWENNDYHLDYSTSITTDVLGYLTLNDVIATLQEIKELPNAPITFNENLIK